MKGIKVAELFSLNNSLVSPLFEGAEYPFEVLPKIGEFIKKLGEMLDTDIYEQIGDQIWIAKSAKVAASASITGPCII